MAGQSITKATKDSPTDIVRAYRADFALVLPTHVRLDQWVRLTTGLLRRNDKLAAVAKSNPASLLSALLDCARLGLEAGVSYHLVPFGQEIVGIPDYTGVIELIYRAGAVRSVKCEVIYGADLLPDETGEPRFRFNSAMDRPHHNPDWFADRGPMIGAYAYAVMADGSISQVIIRNKMEIDKVKSVSKTAKDPSSPWNKWPDRMWRKTVIKELAKFVPTSAEFRHRDGTRADAERVDPWVGNSATGVNASAPVSGSQAALGDQDVLDGEVVEDGPDGLDVGVWHDRGHTRPGDDSAPRLAWSGVCSLCATDVAGKTHFERHTVEEFGAQQDCSYCVKEHAWELAR